jgi:hypothetical protein
MVRTTEPLKHDTETVEHLDFVSELSPNESLQYVDSTEET